MPRSDWLCLNPVMDVPAWSGYTDWEEMQGRAVAGQPVMDDLSSDQSDASECVGVGREGCGLIADGQT